MPKSSMASLTPRSRSSASRSAISPASSTSIRSLSSMVSALGGRPLSASAAATWAGKCGALSCRSAMFTDTPTSHEAARQAAPCGAHLAQHPLAERDDQPGVLRHREERARRDRLVAAPPADQRLRAGDPGGGELHDRLVLQLKLFPGDRPLQVARHVKAAYHVRVHVRGVDLDPAAAAVLGPGHGHVRVAEHHAGRAAVGERDADARGQPDVPLGDPERLAGDDAGQPLGQLDDLLGARGVLQQHRELVAAPAGDRVLGGHDGAQPPGRLGEHQVARAVADQVVDRGEAVEVEEDDARDAARPTARAPPARAPRRRRGSAGR